jgi:hypothetical protein
MLLIYKTANTYLLIPWLYSPLQPSQSLGILNYTGLFISPSGISEIDCATTKTDTAERRISIGRESLQVFFVLGAFFSVHCLLSLSCTYRLPKFFFIIFQPSQFAPSVFLLLSGYTLAYFKIAKYVKYHRT